MNTNKRFFISIGILFLATGAIFVILLNLYMRKNALHIAQQKAQEMLNAKLAIHTYFTQQLKPSLFNSVAQYLSKDYFDPSWMSSTFAVREIVKLNKQTMQSNIYYKECAINARNPENEADEYEADFLKQLNQSPDLISKSSIREINNQDYLVVMRRGEIIKKSCLRCHDSPENAPTGLIDIYGPKRSFHRKVGNVVSAISIRIPLDKAYESTNRFSMQITGLIIGFLLFLFFIQYFMSRKWIFKPLAKIHKQVQRIASDKKYMGHSLDESKGKKRTEFSHSYHTMSEILQDVIDHFDAIVEERTQKLSVLNNQLLLEINARKEAEKRTKENAARYQGIFENTKNGIAVYRAVDDGDDFVFVEFNRGGEKIEKIDRKELIGQRVTTKFAGVKKYGLFEVFQRVWKTGQPEFFPLGFYQDGRVSGWRDNYVYRLDSGEVVALYNDQTKQKQAEEALAHEKERLFVTLQSIGDGVISTDQKGTVLLLNRVASELTGWSIEDAVGKPVSQVFRIINEKTRTPCQNPVRKVMNTGRIIGLANHTMLISKDGTERLIADSGAPISNNKNEIIGVVLVFRDITEQQKQEQQLHQAQKMEAIGTLAGGIAHDFNNMLGIITGNSSYALSFVEQSHELFQILSEILDGAQKAQTLTHQLLTFSQGGEPIKKISHIGSLLKKTTEFVTRGSSCKCRFDIKKDLWAAEVDSAQIDQVISNIVLNARQAMPDGGNITISAQNVIVDNNNRKDFPVSKGQYIKICIQDEGIGIAHKHLNNIFNPYFTTKQKGSGLGLATSYSIIKRHDGHIHVESELNEGSEFQVYLKANQAEAPLIKTDTNQTHSGDGTILIMDDDPAILKMAKRMFSRLGYQVELAPDGQQAIDLYEKAMAESHPFDFVILDLTVRGGMGGAATISELKKIDPNVKAIVSSGYSNDPIMSHYQEYGFVGVIPKPYTKNQVAEVLNALIS